MLHYVSLSLTLNAAYHYSPRLFTAYAAALANAGKKQEAQRWERLAHMAEAALGQGDYAEPEIFDIYGESDLLEPEENPVTDEQPDSVETADLSEQEEAETTSENTGVKETEAGTDELHGENAPNVADEESGEDSIIDVERTCGEQGKDQPGYPQLCASTATNGTSARNRLFN